MSQHTGPVSEGDSPRGITPAPATRRTAAKKLTVVASSVVALGALATFVILPAVHGSTPSGAGGLNVQQEADATGAEPAAIQAPVHVLSTAAPAPRDPFSPLIVPTTAAPPASVKASASTTASTASLAPTVSATPTTVVPAKITIDLFAVSSSTKSAEVLLNSALYVVKEGQTFGGSFMLLGLTATTATFDYGDQPFTLGVGQSQTFS